MKREEMQWRETSKRHLSPLQNVLDFRDNFVRALEMEEMNEKKTAESMLHGNHDDSCRSKSTQMWDFRDMMREIEREHLFGDTVSIAIGERQVGKMWRRVWRALASDLEVCVALRIPENITNPCFSIKNMFFN